MTLIKRINAQIKELSAIEGGKVNMDAPMFRAFLKAQAKLMAYEWIDKRRDDHAALVSDLASIELKKLKRIAKAKPKKRGRK